MAGDRVAYRDAGRRVVSGARHSVELGGGAHRIILVRHGRSALRLPKQVASDAVRGAARRYEAAGIRRTPPPSMALRRHARAAAVLACSDTRRAVESARFLDSTREPLIDPLFREAGVPL